MRMRIPTGPNDVVTSAHAVVVAPAQDRLARGDRVHVCGTPALATVPAQSTGSWRRRRPSKRRQRSSSRGTRTLVMDDIRSARRTSRAIGRPVHRGEPRCDLPGRGRAASRVGRDPRRRRDGVRTRRDGRRQARPRLFRLALERAGVERVDRTSSSVTAPTPTSPARMPPACPCRARPHRGDAARHDLPTSLRMRPDWILQVTLAELLRSGPRRCRQSRRSRCRRRTPSAASAERG